MTDGNRCKVVPGAHLTLHYRITLVPDEVDLVNTFDGKPATLQLGIGQLAEPLEAHLIGLDEGATRCFDLNAGEAYGDRNPALVQRVSRSALARADDPDAPVRPGDLIEIVSSDGRKVAGRLAEMGDTHATLDFNHPLAGKAMRVEVRIIGVL
jgi:FKBP-type peptidyl-prolyl cis-trans isomerase SlpA